LRIFLSRPTWIPPAYDAGIGTFMTQLANLGLDPRTLGVSDYPSKSPLDEVIEILGTCKGAIVLGIPQIEVQTGSLKGAPLSGPLILGTEWNHLEAALAYAAGLPVLVISHFSVTRGIFDRGVMNAFVHSVDLSTNNWSMQPSLNGAISQWKTKCTNSEGNRISSKQPEALTDKPICPNCVNEKKRVYMSPIPAPFNKLAGGNWQCKSCSFVQ
jgi:hypothetical protein